MKKLFYALETLVMAGNRSLGRRWRKTVRPRLKKWRPYRLRLRFLYNAFRFDTFGRRCSLDKNLRILGTPHITLGSHVALRANLTIGGNGRLQIGDHSMINDHGIISCYESIDIGRHVIMGPQVILIDIDHAFSDHSQPIQDQGYHTAPIVIEDNVWIGAQCVITRGVTIGSGSIIAANSVVTKDIPPNVIVAGNPAAVIRSR